MRKITKLFLVSLLLAGGCFSCLSKNDAEISRLTLFQDHLLLNVSETTNIGMSRAEHIMMSIATAFPRQIERLEFRNDDWAVLLRDTWFFYAEGRLLPEHMLDYIEEYTRHHFYYYPRELPPWQAPTPEQIERFRAWEINRRENPPRRAPYFKDALWRIHSREEALQRTRVISFLGHNIRMHYMILENMVRVEQAILEAARADPAIQTWINGLRRIEHFSWRTIEGSLSRSFHSYGLAVDFIPRSFGGREAFWRWTMNNGIDWWTVPHSGRWHPPDAVIQAFERYGFVWGGKWLQFDTIHFEYRPDILIFNGMPPETRR